MGDSRMNRKDNLYHSDGSRSSATTDYDKKHWTYGGLSEEKVIERDWSGKNVIVFKQFIDFSIDIANVVETGRFREIWRKITSEPPFKAGDKSRRNHKITYISW